MNIFQELKPHIEAFKSTRDHIVGSATLPPAGKPPFAVDDGTHCYAVIDADGTVSPLPFGYQVSDDDIDMDGAPVVFNTPMTMAGGDMDFAKYVPLVEDFDIPGERAFCLETAEDSDAWKAVGETVENLQQTVNESALTNFNQRLSNAITRLYESYDAFDSVDQAIAVLVLQSSILPVLFIRSYRHALDALEAELIDDEGDEE